MLGNKATASRLTEVLRSLPGAEVTIVTVDWDDHARYPAPRWARLTSAWESGWVAGRKVAEQAPGTFDLLFVNTWEYVMQFRDMAQRMPAVALMDAVPSTFHHQLQARGLGGWKRQLAFHLQHRRFRDSVLAFDRLLPMGSDCRQALVQDYGVPRERCAHLTLSPQEGSPAPRAAATRLPLRLIWVGNNFSRKGGEFLLQLYRTHLSSFCTLTLVSNDAAIADVTLPEGVRWLRGLERDGVLQALQESDLFLFPSRQDFMPQVLGEALMAGVPCIASDIGGIPDLVITGRTGFLMPYDASPERWVEAVHSLRERPEELGRLSKEAQAFAAEFLSFSRFAERIGQTVAEAQTSGAHKLKRS